jgi:hypothetical protein
MSGAEERMAAAEAAENLILMLEEGGKESLYKVSAQLSPTVYKK